MSQCQSEIRFLRNETKKLRSKLKNSQNDLTTFKKYLAESSDWVSSQSRLETATKEDCVGDGLGPKIENYKISEKVSCEIAFLKLQIKELERHKSHLEKQIDRKKDLSGGVTSNFARENLQLRKKIAELERKIFNN